jgi:hypothetical protein
MGGRIRMQIVTVTALDGNVRLPWSNPFKLGVFGKRDLWVSGVTLVRTGLKISLPPGTDLKVRSVDSRFAVVAHVIGDELECMVCPCGEENECLIRIGAEFAEALVVEERSCKVRFVERNADGRRVVTGGAKEAVVEDDG